MGETLETEGAGFFTVKVSGALVPPEEATVMDKNPALERSAAVSVAVNWAPLTKLVLRLAPFTWTTDEGVKFEPVAVRVIGPLPTTALVGEMLVSEGAGLLTTSGSAAEAPPRDDGAMANVVILCRSGRR